MLFGQQFTITTPFCEAVVRQRLLDVVEPRQAMRWGWNAPAKPYQGEVGDRTFQISRIIGNRNSFLPQIEGRIYPQDIGCKIDIEMKLHPLVLGFMLFWLGMVGQIAVGFLIVSIAERQFRVESLVPIGMFAFGCLLPVVGFVPEARSSRAFLTDLLTP